MVFYNVISHKLYQHQITACAYNDNILILSILWLNICCAMSDCLIKQNQVCHKSHVDVGNAVT